MKIQTPFKLIALVGGSGAGKTWLADRLCQDFGDEAASLSLDNFYSDLAHLKPAEREKINFDNPDAIDWPLFESVLHKLQQGVTTATPHYDFTSHTRSTEWKTLTPRPFIFVEGLWLLWPPQMREIFDLRIYLDCIQSVRFQRRLARDLNERGRTTNSILEQFSNTVAPMHERFVEVQKAWADLVIEESITEAELRRLIRAIRALSSDPVSTLLPIADPPSTPQVVAIQSL